MVLSLSGAEPKFDDDNEIGRVVQKTKNKTKRGGEYMRKLRCCSERDVLTFFRGEIFLL